MEKMKKCKACGQEIAKSAKTCPHCGASNKNIGCCGVIAIVLAAFCIVGIIGAALSDSTTPALADPTQAVNVSTAETKSVAEEATEAPTFGVGDRLEMNGVYVTLESVTESAGSQYNKPSDGNVFVICEFTIENETSSDIAVSSILSFEAYFDDYAANLSIGALAIDQGKQQLDGTVAAGKKMNGVVGYEAPADWKELELHYSASVYSIGTFVFNYSK